MAWWVTGLLAAAPHIYSAFTKSGTESSQASLNAQYAAFNANAIRSTGELNASSILAIGDANAKLALAAAQGENVGVDVIADYNSERSIFLGEYNARLLEEEALLVLEQADLSLSQMKRQHDYALGRVKVAYAASGAIADTDSAGMAIEEQRRQQELDQFVVRRGADVQYSKLMDKAALSRWQGYEEANKMQLEARVMTSGNSLNSMLSAAGSLTQSAIDASTTKYNSSVKAGQAFQSGMLASDRMNSQANQSFWSGMFQAGTTLASSYIRGSAANDSLLEYDVDNFVSYSDLF